LTTVTLFWGEETGKEGEAGKNLLGVESIGHAGGGCQGEDVVCAAVSTLIHALYVGLRDVAKAQVEWEADASVPFIGVRWPKETAAEANLLTMTVALSLKEIASRYAGHVSILEVYHDHKG
jgi:uncharacterized protein YsxB (DUF464 family)